MYSHFSREFQFVYNWPQFVLNFEGFQLDVVKFVARSFCFDVFSK